MKVSIIILILSVLWLGSEIALARLKRSQATDRQFDKSSLRIIWTSIFVSVPAGFLLSYRQFGHFGNESPLFPLFGIALILAGLIVRWSAIFSLKRAFTVDVAITKEHRIVKQGLYRFIRHPAYAGTLLSFLGLGLSLSNYLSMLILFVPICAAFLYRIHVEENALVGVFGEQYRDYCASTKRLIPGIF